MTDRAADAMVDIPGPPRLRSPHSVALLERLGPERMLVIVPEGDFYPDTLWYVAFELDGSVAWDRVEPMPNFDPVDRMLGVPVGDDLWIVVTSWPRTYVWRNDPDGTIVAEAIHEGFGAYAAALPTPTGGLLLEGYDMIGEAFLEMAADGTELWRGPTNLAAMDRAEVADGLVRHYDAAGVLQWEHDPRPAPFANFPDHVGATMAQLDPASLEVVAAGTAIGEGGDNALIVRVQTNGIPRWTVLRPHAEVTSIEPGPGESTVVVGQGNECYRRPWMAVFDFEGIPVFETRGSWNLRWAIDALGRPVSAGTVGDGVRIEWYPEATP